MKSRTETVVVVVVVATLFALPYLFFLHPSVELSLCTTFNSIGRNNWGSWAKQASFPVSQSHLLVSICVEKSSLDPLPSPNDVGIIGHLSNLHARTRSPCIALSREQRQSSVVTKERLRNRDQLCLPTGLTTVERLRNRARSRCRRPDQLMTASQEQPRRRPSCKPCWKRLRRRTRR